MAVRAFNGTSDDLVCSPGAASAMTYGTAVFLIKQTASRTLEVAAFSLRASGGTPLRAVLGITGTGTIRGILFNGADYDDTSGVASGLNNWLLCAVRKPTGSVAGRWSIYNKGTSTWTHFATADTTLANWTAIGATGTIGFWDGDQYPPIRIAARALWVNSLPWSADTSGDAAIEAAGLETDAQNWLDASPDLMHEFNQASTSTAVADLVGDSDQTSISGTTVVTGDDPPGFSFTSSSSPGTITTVVGTATAAGGSSTFTGAGTMSTTAGGATAAGGAGDMTGAATMTTVVGGAAAAGGVGAFTAPGTMTTVMGSATAEGGTGSFSGDTASALTTVVGTATAAGGVSTFTGAAVFATTAGAATAAGGTGSLIAGEIVALPERLTLTADYSITLTCEREVTLTWQT